MACGAPVLTTHRTSLPEVGGDAVAYTEPDAASIKVALRGLIDDGAQRESLGNSGYARSLAFTWAASAQAPMACYERAAAARQGQYTWLCRAIPRTRNGLTKGATGTAGSLRQSCWSAAREQGCAR